MTYHKILLIIGVVAILGSSFSFSSYASTTKSIPKVNEASMNTNYNQVLYQPGFFYQTIDDLTSDLDKQTGNTKIFKSIIYLIG